MRPIAAVFIVVLAIVLAGMRAGLHKINEGHVGVYYRGGALLSSITDPGLLVFIIVLVLV